MRTVETLELSIRNRTGQKFALFTLMSSGSAQKLKSATRISRKTFKNSCYARVMRVADFKDYFVASLYFYAKSSLFQFITANQMQNDSR